MAKLCRLIMRPKHGMYVVRKPQAKVSCSVSSIIHLAVDVFCEEVCDRLLQLHNVVDCSYHIVS